MKLTKQTFTGIVLILAASAVQAVPVTTSLKGDQFGYEHISQSGSSDYIGLWAYVYNPDDPVYGSTQFPFNYMMSVGNISFNTQLPNGITGNAYTITSAKLEFTHSPNATWDPSSVQLKIFAAGFGPTYTETGWTENSPYVGAVSIPPAHHPRDPYPRDFNTDIHAEDNINATAWSIGSHPAYTTASGTSSEFKVTFDLNVSDPKIETELRNDISSGLSSWILMSTFPLGGTEGGNPQVIARGTSNVNNTAKHPKLIIEIEATSGIDDWTLF